MLFCDMCLNDKLKCPVLNGVTDQLKSDQTCAENIIYKDYINEERLKRLSSDRE